MAGRLAIVWLLLGAALFSSGCVAPRPTWVRHGTAPNRQVGASDAPKPRVGGPPVDTSTAGGHGGSGERVHVVQKGENLYRISLLYGVSQDELADANEITDPTRLAVGTELVIPGQRGSSQPQPSSTAGAKARASSPSRNRGASTVSSREPERDSDSAGTRLRWPVQGVLYSRFGPRGAARHDGIDIAAPEGTLIRAAADGTVIYAGTQRGYGNIVILRHDGDLITLYAHNQKNLAKEGETIRAGHPIATVGRTGRASGPHCHFEVRRGTTPHDPLQYLPR